MGRSAAFGRNQREEWVAAISDCGGGDAAGDCGLRIEEPESPKGRYA